MTQAEIAQLLAIAAISLVIFLMARRVMRPRPLRIETTWRGPAFMTAAAALFFSTRPMPSVPHAEALALTVAVGLVLGWLRGRLVDIAVEPDTGNATQRGTPLGLVFLVALGIVRTLIRAAALRHPELGLDVEIMSEFLIAFAFGMLSGYPLALNHAYRRAIARQAAAPPSPGAA